MSSRRSPLLRTTRTLAVSCVLLSAFGAARLDAQVAGATQSPAARLDSLRRIYRVQPAPVQQITVATFLGAPGSSLGSPAATGAGGGDYFVGVGFQERTRYTSRPDGGLGVGTGFGDPDGGLALEVVLTSFSSVRHAPMSIGGLSFKIHHRDPQHLLLFSAGIENAITWGNTDGGTSVFGTLGRVFVLRPAENAPLGVLSASIGIGNGRFRSETDVRAHRSTVGVFGGLGLRLIPSVAAVADWTGQDLDAGFTITPFPGRGIVGSIGFADATRHAGNGPRFIMSIGYGFNAHRDNRTLSPEDLHAVFRSP